MLLNHHGAGVHRHFRRPTRMKILGRCLRTARQGDGDASPRHLAAPKVRAAAPGRRRAGIVGGGARDAGQRRAALLDVRVVRQAGPRADRRGHAARHPPGLPRGRAPPALGIARTAPDPPPPTPTPPPTPHHPPPPTPTALTCPPHPPPHSPTSPHPTRTTHAPPLRPTPTPLPTRPSPAAPPRPPRPPRAPRPAAPPARRGVESARRRGRWRRVERDRQAAHAEDGARHGGAERRRGAVGGGGRRWSLLPIPKTSSCSLPPGVEC